MFVNKIQLSMGFNMAQASPKTIIQSDYSDVPGVHAIIYIFSMVIREMNCFYFQRYTRGLIKLCV